MSAGPPGPPRLLGARVKRVEDPRLLTGRGRFLDDLAVPDLLHAVFVRSAGAHARIRVDMDDARRAPGLVAVLTAGDLAEGVAPIAPRLLDPGFVATSWRALTDGVARHVGEPVAIVVAESAYAAADAAERVRVAYEPLPIAAGLDAALAAGAPILHAGHADNVLFRRRHRHGDVDGAFARAAVIVRETFTHARVSAAPLEPRGALARWDADGLAYWAGTQVPSIVRAALAGALGVDAGRVRVIVPDTGGGFGQKMHVLPEDVALAAAARAVGRPVKWIETRRENLAAAPQAREARVEIEAAADANGALLAIRARVWSDAGAHHVHPLTASLEPLGTAGILPGPYRTPAYAYEAIAVATNKPPLGAYRGVGMTTGAFVMERTLDLIAARVGVGAAEIRRRNLIARDAYPFASAAGFTYDSGDYPRALERALALAEWDRLTRERDQARAHGRLVGLGIACYTEYTGIGAATYRRRGMADVPGEEAATVAIEADGRVTCRASFPSQGQGHATTVAQIVADRLGVPLDAVRVLQPDTRTSPAGTGTFASRGAVAQAGAVDGAARGVRARVLDLAARALEASAADLVLADGRVAVRGMPDRAVALADLARGAGEPIAATEVFDPPGPAFSGAVHVACVEVDRETGRVAVRAYALVEDCGPVINPLIVEGQIHGAVAQGLGEALGERLVYDADGQLLTGTLMDYALPTASDVPPLAIAHLETPSPLTPGGFKGMGEGGTIGAPAAIANAVADAVRDLGISITALPILPQALRADTR